MRQKVILDVDSGIDDAIAIIMSCNSSALDIIGISTVSGNVTSRQGVVNVLTVLQSLNITDVPVVQGALKPLLKGGLSIRNKKRQESSHGKNGLGNININPDKLDVEFPLIKTRFTGKNSYSVSDFLIFFDSIIDKYRNEKISIIATGPLTNIAHLVMQRPRLLQNNVKEISIMGGAFGFNGNINGSMTNYSEFNFYYDPLAANIVLNSDIIKRKTVVSLDLTLNPKCAFDKKFLDEISNSIITNEHYSSMTARQLICSLFNFKLVQNDFVYLHDIFAVLLVENPSLFIFSKGNIKISLKGKKRGICNFIHDTHGYCSVAIDIDEYQFKNLVKKRLKQLL